MRKLLLFLGLLLTSLLSAQRSYHGVVTIEGGEPLVGVTVVVKGSGQKVLQGTITNEDGYYQVRLSEQGKVTLSFSYIGFVTHEVKLDDNSPSQQNVVLKEDLNIFDEVVVTGIIPKAKNSFTGSFTSVSKDQLLSVGTKDVISSLSNFVPGLQILENNTIGSNPNAMQEINIRGRSSFEGASSMPLFIVDGAEVTIDYIYDMDINNIESVTVLKDASASALYGARAAAGVIVITTKAPEKGTLRFSYRHTSRLSAPDLTQYRMLNSAQKLEYERLAGLYQATTADEQYELDELYAYREALVGRGVNIDWLAKPLRTGYSHNHNLGFEGGDDNARYAVTLRYGNEAGVMKDSNRERLGGIFKLSYQKPNKFFLSNTLSVMSVTGNESPYGTFSNYVIQNPYDSPYDEDGTLRSRLSYIKQNPLYEASLGSFNKSEQFYILNALDANVWILPDLRLDLGLTYRKQKDDTDIFVSPLSAGELAKSVTQRGSYTQSNTKETSFNGKIMLSLNKYLTEKLFMTATLGVNGDSQTSDAMTYKAIGFFSSKLDHPSFAASYDTGQPSGSDAVSRNLGYFVNGNFIYDNKYFVDVIYRYEGSSKFGENQRYAPFWSLGGGWNMHYEKFMQDLDIQNLKLRLSAGYLGNINFSPYQALTAYQYSNSLVYDTGIGAVPITIGNPDLKWERTLSTNFGFDFTALKRRVELSFDVYRKLTDNLLLDVTKAPSVGVAQATENIGSIENRGVELQARYIVANNSDWSLSVFGNYSYNKSKIKSISDVLKAQNEANNRANSVAPLPVYEEGQSMTAVKLVPSAGIDPGTGREVFIKRDGTYTFDYDVSDKRIVGDSSPYGYGTLGAFATYKNWQLSTSFGYSFGASVYNTTLATRVEGSDPRNNADERVFNSRWKQPGDVAEYKDIADSSTPSQSTRFLQTENYLTLRSLSVGYQFTREQLKPLRLQRASIELLTNDLFYLTSVKRERGLDYPFSRTIEMSLRVSF